MELNQEFGERAFVPTGISGDLEIVAPKVAQQEKLAAAAYTTSRRDELAMKINLGTATPEEETELIESFSADVAQGFN